MHRIDTATRATDLFGSGKDGFTDGNPATATLSTRLNASWFNGTQEEICRIVEAAGLALDTEAYNQQLSALKILFGGNVTLVSTTSTLLKTNFGLVLIDASSGNVTVTLPTSATIAAARLTIARIDTSNNTVTIARASTDTIEGATSVGVAVAERKTLMSDGISAWYVIGGAPISGRSTPHGYCSGLEFTPTGSPRKSVAIAAGICRSRDDAADLVIGSTLTKDLTATWAAGNHGGLDTGALANSTWYHGWIIGKPDGTTDAIFTASAPPTLPTLPAGYTKARLVGAVLTDGSSVLRAVRQVGDEVLWLAPIADGSFAVSAGTSTNTVTLLTPPGRACLAECFVSATGDADNDFGIWIGGADQGSAVCDIGQSFELTTTPGACSGSGRVMSDTSAHAKIGWHSDSGLNITYSTMNYRDMARSTSI